ncbi:IS200-IS605 family transposase ISLasa9b [Ligilactobacillus ruminis DPC 6832]|uniref:IS200-IS605 family transposase ISLasa9b n=1 Tax=Ligilactobacillus ruminis DPC 6832 TaxID=1402208 RepID=A0A837DY85_9LACO|nr:IS200-IS605 family transposase ISLasa9b [Ligilactobacillus ruminis DPC 6832]
MQLTSDESFVEAPKADHGHIGIDLNTDNFLTDSEGTKFLIHDIIALVNHHDGL